MVTNLADPKLGPNTISTTKTNKITFLPYNMLFQLTRASNFYFLLIAAMQLVPSITLTFGAPTVLLPLTIVIVCSLLRELFEEIKRHRHDHKENETVVNVLREGKWQTAAAMTLRVGELIRLEANDKVMADVLLLKASELQVYVETMNLDGETTKKGKRAPADLYDLCAGPLGELRLRVDYQPPNPFLYRFEGTLQLPSKSVPLTSENVLLRGSNLRVTKWAEGMVLYSGFNTKVMLNGATPRQKRSRLDRQLQLVMIGLLVVMMATTFSYALASSLIATTTKQAYKATTDGLLQ